MSLIQEVRLALDKASAKRLADEMGRAGKEGGDKLEKEVGGGFDRIKSMAAKVGAVIATAFAIQKVIAFGRSLVTAAMESERSWSRLEASLSSVGVRLAGVRGEIDKLAHSLRDQADNEEVAEVLSDLVQVTGDYQKSLSAVSVVVDLARAKHMSLESAALLVGRAMIGHTETLQRYGIQVTKGGDALEQLRKQFAGFAANEAQTMTGQVRTLGNAWGDAKETFGAFLTEAGGGISIIQALTQSLRWLNAEMDMWATAAKHEKEIELGGVQARLGQLAGRSDSSLTFQKRKGSMGRITTVGAERAQLLEREKTLLIEVTELARQRFAATQGGAVVARQTEEQIAAALERQKAALEAWDKGAPVWESRRSQEQLARSPMDTSWSKGGAALPLVGHELAGPMAGFHSAALSESIGASVSQSLRDLAADPPGEMLSAWNDVWASLSNSSANIANGLVDMFAGAFAGLRAEGNDLAGFFEGMGASIWKSLAQGASAYATSRALQNTAKGFDDLADAASYAAEALATGNIAAAAGAIMAKKAAVAHFARAAGWAALGGAGAALGGMGSTSSGGLGSGYRTGAGTKDSLESERRGATINIRIDGIDPSNPRHGDLVVATMAGAVERHGENAVYVNGRRQG